MRETVVKIEQLSHRYNRRWAIRNINFEIGQNGVLGLLGSNGAGKSTTMNILCGVLRQTEGTVSIAGVDLRRHPKEAKSMIGFLPQHAPLYPDLTVDEYLTHCAHLRLVEKKKVQAAVDAAKNRCGLENFGRRLIRNLSGGYRQRVGIAQAIIHTPKLVVLDEPTNGLDPIQILEVRSLIREIAEERCVIFSSHILSEIQATCKEVRMIERGRMVFADTIQAFNNLIAPDSMLVSMEAPPAEEVLGAIPGITAVDFLDAKTVRLRFDASAELSEKIVRMSVLEGWRLKEITLERSSPDAIFAQLSRTQITNN